MRVRNDPESAPDPERILEQVNVAVRARDDTRLSVDIYRPVGDGAVPAILSITPYDNGALRSEARWFGSHGYAYVAADQRGRFDSEGDFDFFDARHKDDGHDLVEWIAAQPWCTGKVGIVGASASGWTTWWAASAAPPHLTAIMPLVAGADPFENAPYQQGAITGWLADWVAGVTGASMHVRGPGRYMGWGEARDVEHRRTPYREINAARGIVEGDQLGHWLSMAVASDPFWKAIAYQTPEAFARIRVPSLGITGWFDAMYPATPLNYVGMRRHGETAEARQARMIIGPWNHGINQQIVGGVDFGPNAVFDLDGLTLRWFDHHLKGIDGGFDIEPSVRVFVMGANVWREFEDWPPPDAVPTPYYLSENGGLRTESATTDGVDSYVYDPRDPTPDPFGTNPESAGNLDGPLDTAASAARADVLSYATPPLTSAVEVVGPIEAVLYAATTATDTDWFVRLVDIHPDGRSLLLAEGALRARHRDPDGGGRFTAERLTEVRPGEVTRYTLRFWRDTGNVFAPGHRIGIEISSSWFPYFLPNLNTGADNGATASIDDAVIATQSIHHGSATPSHILLPVRPAP